MTPAWTSGLESDDGGLRPFKAWALQENLFTAMAEPPARAWQPDRSSGGPVLGQSYLKRKLTPDPEFRLRYGTAIVLWGGSVAMVLFNQFVLGIELPTEVLLLLGLLCLLPLASPIAAGVLGRVDWIETGLILGALAINATASYYTGGAASPYMMWLVFPIFFAAYFMDLRNVVMASAVATAAALAPLAYQSDRVDANTATAAVALAAVNLTVAAIIYSSRAAGRRSALIAKALAWADPLTGVANLRALERFAEFLEGRDEGYSIAMVDMNGLRGTNLAFGFDSGDDMLVRLADLLRSASTAEDQVARIGGDEFVVAIPGGEGTADQWRRRFERLTEEHNAHSRLRRPQISCALGFAQAPADGGTLSELLAVADARMFEQKVPAVQPPHVVEATAPTHSERILGRAELVGAVRSSPSVREDGREAALLWALVGALTLGWVALPGASVPEAATTVAFGLGCFALAGIALLARVERLRRPVLRAIDLATLTMLFPGLVVTGGWESPLLVVILLIVTYYAQFYRGFGAAVRLALAIGLFTAGFWIVGGATDAAASAFLALTGAALIVAALMLANGRRIDESARAVLTAASRDALTGLLNIHAFTRDIESAIGAARGDERSGEPRPGLVIADVDRFHDFNNRFGHQGGDLVLCEIARRLAEVVPDQDCVYRIDGDEFALLVATTRADEIEQLVERCRRQLTFSLPDGEYVGAGVTATVCGAAMNGHRTAEQLMSAAKDEIARSKHRAVMADPGEGVFL